MHEIQQKRVTAYIIALFAVGICTALGCVLSPYLNDSNLIMIYLLGVCVVALIGKKAASVLASILSVLSFDFFFVPPFYSFSVSDIQYFLTLIVMLIVTLLISHLTIQVREAKLQTEIERFRNTLLLSISHDLRTPLTSIMGSASVLLQDEKKLTETMRNELTQIIYDESERLNNLVNNVLQIIRLETTSITLKKQPYSMQELINSVLDKMEKSISATKIALQFSSALPLVSLDAVLLQQVLINLLENALKFSPQNAPITISVEQKNNNVLVKIADCGSGLAESDRDKIFAKFYRGQKPETNGLGLGLAICKSIISLHCGQIWAENRPQGGAVFCFTLPIMDTSC